jgi:hypothetical protein
MSTLAGSCLAFSNSSVLDCLSSGKKARARARAEDSGIAYGVDGGCGNETGGLFDTDEPRFVKSEPVFGFSHVAQIPSSWLASPT